MANKFFQGEKGNLSSQHTHTSYFSNGRRRRRNKRLSCLEDIFDNAAISFILKKEKAETLWKYIYGNVLILMITCLIFDRIRGNLARFTAGLTSDGSSDK